GAVIDPSALDRLLPEWRMECPEAQVPVTADKLLFLTAKSSFEVPPVLMPPLMSNHGNFVVSLGNVGRLLAEKAEGLGVDIYPGFAASELVRNDAGTVLGIATGDTGLKRDGTPSDNYQQGMELLGKYTLLAEGARGSLSKQATALFGL